MSAFRILGIVLAVFGTVASIFPDWFAFLTGPPSADTFETVERRVRGGMVLGAGLILIAVPALRPWSTSIPLVIFYFMTGALAARLLGLLVDGVTSKQWLLVAVEAAGMTLAAFWMWRSSGGET